MNNGKHGQGTHCTKMDADSMTENTPKIICPICLPKLKSLEFQWKKASLGVRSPWLWVLKIRERLMQFIINVSSHFSLTFLVHFAKNELLLLHAYQEWFGFGFSHLNSQVLAWQIKIHLYLRAHIIKPILIICQYLY